MKFGVSTWDAEEKEDKERGRVQANMPNWAAGAKNGWCGHLEMEASCLKQTHSVPVIAHHTKAHLDRLSSMWPAQSAANFISVHAR